MKNMPLQEEITRYCHNATEVWEFLCKMPSPLSQMVFKRAADIAYTFALVQTPETAKRQLLEAIAYSVESTSSEEEILHLATCLEAEDYAEEISWNLGAEPAILCDYLLEHCTWSQIPPKEGLLRAHGAFRISDNAEAGTDEFLHRLRENFNRGMVLGENPADSIGNPFLLMGFQTLLEKWACSILPRELDSLMFRWYCKGEIIDLVIDTILNSGICFVSDSILKFMDKEAEYRYYLSVVFQERFDNMRRHSLSLQPHTFEYKGESIPVTLRQFNSLETIPQTVGLNTAADPLKVCELYLKLRQEDYIGCAQANFQSAFAGYWNTTEPIIWHKDQKSLASFLYYAHGTNRQDLDYAARAAMIFRKSNGSACKANTLNQPKLGDPEDIKMRALFNEVGINR